jgi:hypothetical protein
MRKFIFDSKAPQSDQQHTINSVQFKDDLGRANVQVVLRAVEEWTIENTTSQPGAIDHPLHIQINPYQITEVFDPNEGLVDPETGTLLAPARGGSAGRSWRRATTILASTSHLGCCANSWDEPSGTARLRVWCKLTESDCRLLTRA